MMNIASRKVLLFACASLVAGFAAEARAAVPMDGLNELEGTSFSALTFGSGVNTTFGIGAGYSRQVTDMFQATAFAGFNLLSQPVGAIDSITLKVGPTFNLPLDSSGIRNAFYFTALGGLALTSNSSTGTTNTTVNFAYSLQIGKRFEIFSGLIWKPAFDMSGITATNSNPLFSIIPAQFSFIF